MASKNELSLEKIIGQPSSALEFLIYATISFIVGLTSNGNPLGFVGVGVIFVIWYLLTKRTNKRRQELLDQYLQLDYKSEQPSKARGLILLLSPYNAFNLRDRKLLETNIEVLLTKKKQDLEKADFEAIGLFDSNLVPQIKAIEYHYQEPITLRDVWLISSKSDQLQQVRGSEQTAEILAKYCEYAYPNLFINKGEDYIVEDWNYNRIWRIAQNIFSTQGYTDSVIVADITGGTKMMSVALAMACVPINRKMQYMSSQRDWDGQPIPHGEMIPVGIDVDPILYVPNLPILEPNNQL
jgi:hypothetical protein